MHSLNVSTPDDKVTLDKSATTSNFLCKISLDEDDGRNRKKGNLLSQGARIILATLANTDNLIRLTKDKKKLWLANDKHKTNFQVYGPNEYVQIVRCI